MVLSSPAGSSLGNLRSQTADNERAEYELVVDHTHVMLHQELTAYPCCTNYTSASDNVPINNEWRHKICEWAFEVVDHFDHSREAVSLAMNYLDRFMSNSVQRGAPLSRKGFQLAAIACVHIAVKISCGLKSGSRKSRGLDIAMLVELSQGRFSADIIEEMERRVLTDLGWRLNPPTAVRFIYHFMLLLQGTNVVVPDGTRAAIFEIARYLSELSVCVSSLSIERKPSVVAFASVLCSMECLDPHALPEDAQDALIDALADITQLSPVSEEMQEVCQEIRHTCPAHFQPPQDIPEEQKTSRSSPVCVAGHKRRHPSAQ